MLGLSEFELAETEVPVPEFTSSSPRTSSGAAMTMVGGVIVTVSRKSASGCLLVRCCGWDEQEDQHGEQERTAECVVHGLCDRLLEGEKLFLIEN